MDVQTSSEYITPEQVCEMVPGLTKNKLAQLRLVAGKGPRFYKPTSRTVLYKRGEVLEWIEDTVRMGTAEGRI